MDQSGTTPRTLTVDDLKRLPWRSIGPATMGGRVSALSWGGSDRKTFYVGYASGGLWKTTNLGTTFSPIFDGESTSSIGAVVAVDAPATWAGWTPEERKSKSKADLIKAGRGKIVWVGTGEGNGRNSSSWGNGVYRSTDAGATWTHCGLSETHDIPAMAVDPGNPDVCYVAALGHLWGANPERGLYKTTDGGASWTQVLAIDAETGCCDVALDPVDPTTVYAAMMMRRRTPYSFQCGGPEGGLYKSTDSGATWRKLEGGLPRLTGRIGLSVHPKKRHVLVAVVQSHEGGTTDIRDDRSKAGGVFRSEDGGETWTRLSQRSPRAFYFSRIYLDPVNDQRVWMLGWNIELSEDGGRTFRGGLGEKCHVDHHAFLINPDDPDHLVNGNDGGTYQSFDGGKSWQFLSTMAVGQFYNVAVDQSDPYRVAGGLQDNGSWFGPSATNRQETKWLDGTPQASATNFDWQHYMGGDGFHVAFDPQDPNTLYAEWQGGNLYRLQLDPARRVSIKPVPPEGGPRFRFNWNAPFFVSPHDPTVLYLGGNTVFRLLDRGARWERISEDLTTMDPLRMDRTGSSAEQHCTLVALAESERQAGVLWAGSDDGLIHVTQDGGTTWTNVTPPQVGGLYVSRLEPSHHAVGRCYASVDGHRSDVFRPILLRTDDFGATWTEVHGDLPADEVVKVVREDRASPDVLYVGTERGLFVSVNGGGTWLKAHGKALPTTPIDDVVQHPRETDLVLGTHGRSIWVLDDASCFAHCTSENLQLPFSVFPIRPAQPRRTRDLAGQWTDQAFRPVNPTFGLRAWYWVREFAAEDVAFTVEDAQGVTVAKLAGSNAPGLHRLTWDCQPLEQLRLADEGEEPSETFFCRPGRYVLRGTFGTHATETPFEVLAPK